MELSQVIPREKLRNISKVDTEHLVTLAVAMQKTQEAEWLATYATIGSVSAFVARYSAAVCVLGGGRGCT